MRIGARATAAGLSCALALALSLGLATPATAQITGAAFADPTDRYAHAILGDAVEWGDLRLATSNGAFRLPLPDTQVYEDLTPRLWDVTGDGQPEVVVIHTDIDLGARLLVIGLVDGQPRAIAATPYIGQTRRWLAPVGAADLDGDGRVEIAVVDRPHLAKTLQIWRMGTDGLTLVAQVPGLTSHRIGDAFFSGGLTCDGTGVVTYSADWSRLAITTLSGDRPTTRDAGPNTAAATRALLDCAD